MSNETILKVGIAELTLREMLPRCYRTDPRYNPAKCYHPKNPQFIMSVLMLIFNDSMKKPFELITSNDGGYGHGSTDVNNSTGLVKDIIEGQMDASIPYLDMTYDRSLAVSFGPMVQRSRYTLIVNQDFGYYNNDYHYWKVFTPLSYALWLAQFAALNALTRVAQMRLLAYRCRTLSFYIALMLFAAIFNSEIITTRSVSKFVIPFVHIIDAGPYIETEGYRFISEMKDSGAVNHILYSKDPKYGALQQSLRKFPVELVNTSMLFKMIRSSKKIFTYADEKFGQYLVTHYYDIQAIIDKKTGYVMQGMMLNPKKKKLCESIIGATLAVIEGGHVEKVFKYSAFDNKATPTSKRTKPNTHTAFKWSDFATTFYMLFAAELCIAVHFAACWVKKRGNVASDASSDKSMQLNQTLQIQGFSDAEQ